LLAEIEKILDGIDRTEVGDGHGGWWETSTGAAFGEERLERIRELFKPG
jgi:hypothetical protein